MSNKPNRFLGLPYVNIDLIRVGFWSGVILNVVIILVVIFSVVAVGVFLLSFRQPPTPSSEFERARLPVILASVTPTAIVFSLSTPISTPIPFTPLPTSTPLPTVTPSPTVTPLPTQPPISFTIIIPSTPVPVRRLYNFQQLQAISRSLDFPKVDSIHPFGFYRALCVPAVPAFIQPRVVGLPENIGLIWRVWNDYGWLDELDFTNDVTFYLSEDPSVFHLALFWYDDRISDQVDIDFPGSCVSTQVIFIQSSPPIADNVEVSHVAVSD